MPETFATAAAAQPATAAAPQPANAAAPQPANAAAAQPSNGQPAAVSPEVAAERARIEECVRLRTAAIADYRAGRIPKHIAVSKCLSALLHARITPDALKDDLAALDQHDRSREAAAVAGAATAAGAGAGGGNPVPPSLAAIAHRRKRALSIASSGHGSDNDSEDDSARDDKRTYRPGAAGFKKARRVGLLPPLIRNTLSIRDNYLADLKRAKRDLLRDGFAPAFPDDLWEFVLADRFVDFGRLLARRFATHIPEDNVRRISKGVSIKFDEPEVTKEVADQSDWNDAFSDWSAAVLFTYPHRFEELAAYKEFIGDLFRSTHKAEHSRVISADAAIRVEVANNGRLSFADTLRHRATADRVLSPYGADANLVRAATNSAPSTAPPSSSAVSRWKPSGQVCKNFNANRCTHPQCRHAHVCDVCHSVGHSGLDHTVALDEQPAAVPQPV